MMVTVYHLETHRNPATGQYKKLVHVATVWTEKEGEDGLSEAFELTNNVTDDAWWGKDLWKDDRPLLEMHVQGPVRSTSVGDFFGLGAGVYFEVMPIGFEMTTRKHIQQKLFAPPPEEYKRVLDHLMSVISHAP